MAFSLINLISLAANIYSILIIIRVILSWVSLDPRNTLVGRVYRLTEPVLGPVRNLLPSMGGIDFSPILVLVGIQLLENVVVRMLIGMAME